MTWDIGEQTQSRCDDLLELTLTIEYGMITNKAFQKYECIQTFHQPQVILKDTSKVPSIASSTATMHKIPTANTAYIE